MKLYNTKTRKLETFKPENSENVKIYTCGPTVYGRAHIGNLTAYIYWDLLVRVLKANKMTPNRVLNLTDVGHLVSDEDEGEDKIEKGARQSGKTVWEVADFYIEQFLKDFRALNLTEPEKICRATDYIEADKKLVKTMLEKGFAYETRDGIYFDTAKFPDYAKFGNLDLEGLKAGARVDFSQEKHNVSDFAIWKFIQPGEKHAMRWEFSGKEGYPGWHLECSTIIHEELGEPIDIHTGGIDHIPVHHTNEIAQTFAISGLELARFWLHCNFINIDGYKISKSLGNVYTLDDLAEKGFSALDFKLWVLQGHYQGERNFTFEGLSAAKTRRLNWRNKIAELKQTTPVKNDSDMADTSGKLLEIVNNNLNSAEVFALVDNSDLDLKDWRFVDELFGLELMESVKEISAEQRELLKQRELARTEKDWAQSDTLRAELEQTGLTVKDTASGQIWQYLE